VDCPATDRSLRWWSAPRYIIRDRDGAYGEAFIRRVRRRAYGSADSALAWQNGYAERVIGSIRRDCLDHVVVLASGICAICSIRTGNYNETRTSILSKMRRIRALCSAGSHPGIPFWRAHHIIVESEFSTGTGNDELECCGELTGE